MIEDMEELGCSRARRTATSPLPYSDRSKTPIEPYLSDQWFVKMGDHDGQPGWRSWPSTP